MKKCNNCLHENPDDAKFCINCGAKLEEAPIKEEYTAQPFAISREPINKINRISRILAAISAIMTILDTNAVISVIGLSLSVGSIALLAIGFILGKMKGRLRLNLFLNIYSFLAHFGWLAYHLWIAPAL